jgi:hypothetical protein
VRIFVCVKEGHWAEKVFENWLGEECVISCSGGAYMIRKLASGEYRLYSRKKDPKTGRRRNLGTFNTRAAAEKHERAVQYFKRHN